MIAKEKLLELEERWNSCQRCRIGSWAFRHVYGNGAVPAKYLFIGEGPGVSEDVLGEPFVGKSGKLFRTILKELGFKDSQMFITNLVSCRPCDGPGKPNRAPDQLEINNCSRRLQEIMLHVKPKIIVAVGNVAMVNLENYSQFHIRKIYHPAFILRNGGKNGPEFDAWVDSIRQLKRLGG
jgi:uracil-DNA glycosylase family 4